MNLESLPIDGATIPGLVEGGTVLARAVMQQFSGDNDTFAITGFGGPSATRCILRELES